MDLSCEKKNSKGPMWKVNKIEDSLIKKGKEKPKKTLDENFEKVLL